MFRVARDYLYSLVGILASIVTLILFMYQFDARLSKDGRVAIYFIGTLLIWYFIESLYLKVRWGRERRYAQTIAIIAGGFGEIHRLHREGANIERAVVACEKLCDSVASAFTIITGTKCNACIKTMTYEDDCNGAKRAKAITFARSRDQSRNPKANNVRHWIDKNTDFLTILEKIDTPRGEYFFSNSLVFRFGYQNTSFDVYGKIPDNNWLFRYWRWPLPYKSTIVVPICPSASPASSNLVGFFCVDSREVGAFKKDFDVALIEGVADGVFNTIFAIHTAQEKQVGGEA